MGRNGLRKKNNCLIDNDDVKLVELRKSSKTTSIKENLPKQHVEELVYQGNITFCNIKFLLLFQLEKFTKSYIANSCLIIS